MHLGSRWLFKTPSPAFWVDLVDRMLNAGWNVFLTGSASGIEGEFVDYVQRSTGAHSLAGQTSLGQLARLINSCDIYVGVDSFASHIASSCNVRGVVLLVLPMKSRGGH